MTEAHPGWGRLALAALVLHLVLIQPNHPGAMTWGAFGLIALDLPVLLGVLACAGGRGLRVVLVAVLTLGAVLKLADLSTFTAFGRGFDPVVDLHLLPSGWRLMAGALGGPLAALALAGAVLGVAAVAALLWWACGVWSQVRLRGTGRAAAVAGTMTAALFAVAEIGHSMGAWRLPFDPPGAAFTARLAVERGMTTRRTLIALAAFRTQAASDPVQGLAAPLARLTGRDVLVVFVESYARTSFDTALYAGHRDILRQAEAPLAAAGLAVRSGWLASPVEGGQSWLAHATLASGLRIPDQPRHDALLATPRRTLFQIAQGAGWRTAAVSPAFVLDWPEGARLGFDTYLDRDAMGYRGQPFNWITMPDQFTLARFRDRLVPDARPLFAQITLISSHAPWVPVPVAVPWDAVGDGRIFDVMAASGDPPQVVWRDPDRIRDQYRQAVAYSLTVVMDWAARQTGGPLIVILGDHPPVDFVSLTDRPDVPMHLIGPPEVLAAIDGWGWTTGLIPAAGLPVWPMEAFREPFLTAFSGP